MRRPAVADRLRLKIVGGEGAGREVTIPEAGAVLGRDKQADIVLGEKVLSRRHCRIFRHGERWLVEDLGSRNGTFVNGGRAKRAELKGGDTIQLGRAQLTVVAPAAAPIPAGPSPSAAPDIVRKRRLALITGLAAAAVALGVIAYAVHALSLSSRRAGLREQLSALREQAEAELGGGRYESAVETYEQLLGRASPDTLEDADVRAIVEESRESVEIARRAIESRRKVAQPSSGEPGQTKVNQGLAKEVEERLAALTRKRQADKAHEPESDKRGSLMELRSKAPLCGWPTDYPFLKEKPDYFGGLDTRAAIIVARGEQVGKKTLDDWASVLQGHGVSVTTREVFLGLCDASALYKGTKLNAELNARCLARLKSIPKGDFASWTEETMRAGGEGEGIFWFALSFSLADPLYDQKDNYSVAAAPKYLTRVKSVSPERTRSWVDHLPAYKHWKCDAVLSMVLTEALFSGDRFDEAAFVRTFPDNGEPDGDTHPQKGAEPAAKTSGTIEERQKKFFEVMGMKDYLEKAEEKPLFGGQAADNPPSRIGGKPMPWFSDTFSVISDKSGSPMGWMWRPTTGQQTITIDELRRRCGPPTKQTGNVFWWGMGGVETDQDGKHFARVYIFPIRLIEALQQGGGDPSSKAGPRNNVPSQAKEKLGMPPGKDIEKPAMPSTEVPSPAKNVEGPVVLPEQYKAEAEKAFAKGYSYFIWPAETGVNKCQGKTGELFRVLIVPFYFVARDDRGVPFAIATSVILKDKTTGKPISRQIVGSSGRSGPRGKGEAVYPTVSPTEGAVLIEGDTVAIIYLVRKSGTNPGHGQISNSMAVPVSF